jgi:N-acetylglutamate synthase-like GNAT family acetyltransferase
MAVKLRPALAADQSRIRKLVWAAHLNPMRLHWSNFLVAEDEGQIVGIGQVRTHPDRSRELASIAVVPEQQGQGIGSQIIRALVDRESGPLYLFCRESLTVYYTHFEFRVVERAALPPILALLYGLGKLMIALTKPFNRRRVRIMAMKRDQAEVRLTAPDGESVNLT